MSPSRSCVAASAPTVSPSSRAAAVVSGPIEIAGVRRPSPAKARAADGEASTTRSASGTVSGRSSRVRRLADDFVARRAERVRELLVPALRPREQDPQGTSATSSAASATGSSPVRRSIQLPSSAATSAVRIVPSWCAATGARHPPPIAATHARSASTRRRVSASSACSTAPSSPARTCNASAPCPASGSSSSGSNRRPISASRPRRSSPHAASTTASRPRSSRFRSRVSMLPRRGSMLSPGSSARSWARRRIDAVPTRMPGRTSDAPQSASRGSSRSRYAPTASPSVSVEVMSLAECTATSIRPSSSASSSSLTNTPREPISPNGRVRSRSPAVVTGTSANSSPGRRSRSTASSACVSASRLPLEPTRRSTAALLVAGLLQPHDRLVQELVHDLARQRFDGTPLGVRQVGQPRARLRELATPDRLGPLPQRRDCRHRIERREPVVESLAFRSDDLLGLGRLAAAAAQALLDDHLEVVDVVEEAAVQRLDAGIEIPRDGKVDEKERPPLACRKCALDLLPRENGVGRARRRDDDVCLLELSVDALERQRGAAEALGEGGRTVDRPVGNEGQLGAALDEVPGRHLADLSGADDEDPPAGEVSEHLRSEGRRGGRDGGRALADRGFGADALAGMERLPEEPVEERPDRAALVRRADLTLDLSFARDQRIEPGGDAKEVRGRRLLLEAEEVRLELRRRDAAEIGQLGGRPPTGGIRVGRRQVELRPVTRREADGLAALSQPLGERRLAVRVERDPFPHLHGRETMRGSDEQQLHATWAKRSPSWRTMTAATPPRARAAASSRRPARTRR